MVLFSKRSIPPEEMAAWAKDPYGVWYPPRRPSLWERVMAWGERVMNRMGWFDSEGHPLNEDARRMQADGETKIIENDVTPEMIEAGVTIFREFDHDREFDVDDYVVRIFRAMMAKRVTPKQTVATCVRCGKPAIGLCEGSSFHLTAEREPARLTVEAFRMLDRLRADGWSVAVHNDYRLNGTPMTFWLLTHPSGRYIKGEGRTDAEALDQCQEQAARLTPIHPVP